MKRIDTKITHQCNNRCRFCVQGDKKRAFPDMRAANIKKILKDSRAEYSEVVFTGGEVTIRPDIIELVHFAKDLGYNIQIQTNGRMFAYKDFCLKMLNAGAKIFAISIHAHNSKLHDYLTGSKGSFYQTLTGIKNLISLKTMVVTNTVITKPNYRYLPRIAEMLVTCGVKQIQFAFVHLAGNASENFCLIAPRKSTVEPFVKKSIDIGVAAGAKMFTEAIPYCFLKNYEKHVAETNIPQTKIFDFNSTIENFTKVRLQESKLKGPDCPICIYNKKCEGPWREYPQLFGWSEFKPVMTNKGR